MLPVIPRPTKYGELTARRSFDTIYNNWSVIDNDPSLDFIKAPSFGASAVDQNSGVAYSYGGFVREGASNPRQGGGRTPARELVRYDMVQNQWKNVRVFENTARSSGALFYIPASDEGMLVYFGGVQFDDRNNSYSSSPMVRFTFSQIQAFLRALSTRTEQHLSLRHPIPKVLPATHFWHFTV